MPYVIAEPCIDVKDASCVDVCPVDCIYTGGRMLYIQPDECIDCDACVPVCPVDAIYWVDDVPPEWSEYIAANAEFFGPEVTGWGKPGGAYKVGPSDLDHPLVLRRAQEGRSR